MTTERGSAEAGPLSAYLGELDAPVAAAFGAIVARAAALVPGVEQGTTYGMPGLVYRGPNLIDECVDAIRRRNEWPRSRQLPTT